MSKEMCPYLKIGKLNQIPSAICEDTGEQIEKSTEGEFVRGKMCRFTNVTSEGCMIEPHSVELRKRTVVRDRGESIVIEKKIRHEIVNQK